MKKPFLTLYQNDMPGLAEYLIHERINIVDEHNRSLLHHAIKLGSIEAFKLLTGNYIDFDIADDKGNTCFHYAVLHNRLSFLRILFLNGGNPMQRNHAGQTPLYLACLYGKEKIIDLYLEKYQLDMGEKDEVGQTICTAFVLSGNVSLLKKYGNYLPWLEEPNYLGESPLMLAVKLENMKMIEFLLSNNVFINQKDKLGETAIFYAVRKENKEIFRFLLHKGAFLDFKNSYGETIASIASEKMKEYIEECISVSSYQNYARAYPLHYAIHLNDKKNIENYLTLAYAFTDDAFQFTPLMLAEKYHLKDVVKAIKHLNNQAKIQSFHTKL